jgi:hypothetical protein
MIYFFNSILRTEAKKYVNTLKAELQDTTRKKSISLKQLSNTIFPKKIK